MNFTIGDIENVVRIIDTASQRGAFKGDELSAVGSVRDKFASIIQQVKLQEEQKSQEENLQGELSFDTESGKVEEVIEDKEE